MNMEGPRRARSQTEDDLDRIRRRAVKRATSEIRADDVGQTRPEGTPEPLVWLVRNVRWIRWTLVPLVISIIATATVAVRYVYRRAETETEARLERARLLEDVRGLKTSNAEVLKVLRDAQENIRANERAIGDLADRQQQRRRTNP